ncbi:P-loop containing nucleoside triphosphate hydrolase protein [Zychaea mexicana]|uniref:P-loop containing nucleoside triphosphate hydrolase protein n=1 Tax=Zychaea mexicana TaxID=64656 RepID=UPI0022FF2DB1|nr:P-loop containing nucleoside triphosphate hydrolase protein [Zychaea mexicana]KAI9492950.1 P-loop containing nucleoside triphosphate hydrolase protein [Zychaea mexicana]
MFRIRNNTATTIAAATTRRRFKHSLVQFNNANVHRFGTKEPTLENLTLNINSDQRLVIVGSVGAGRSTLAEALAGRLQIQPLSAAKWPVVENTTFPSKHIKLVSFKEDSGAFSYSGHYYQERFNFSDPDNDVTLAHYLGKDADPKALAQVTEKLNLAHLMPLSFVKLSNGQTRRARIARALLRRPAMLILDEPLMGLDVQHRAKLLETLGELDTPVVVVLRPQDEFPAWATDVVAMKNLAIEWTGKPAEYLAKRDKAKQQDEQEREAYRQKMLAQEKQTHHKEEKKPSVVELKDVNVVYSGNKILDTISWTVRQGERWALLGPNGSGKTTLLSFLTGDHPQAYANELYLFGRRRGTGESIWEIKQRVGLVSPEIHLYFNQTMTALEAAGTGFFDVVVPRSLSDEQITTVKRLFDDFGLQSFVDRRLRDMSSGEQRMVLLIRSLVKMPELIIWDEPFQGLDDKMIKSINKWLEEHMRPDQSLILVTHHEDEIPRAVVNRFRLGPGGIAAN